MSNPNEQVRSIHLPGTNPQVRGRLGTCPAPARHLPGKNRGQVETPKTNPQVRCLTAVSDLPGKCAGQVPETTCPASSAGRSWAGAQVLDKPAGQRPVDLPGKCAGQVPGRSIGHLPVVPPPLGTRGGRRRGRMNGQPFSDEWWVA